MALGILNSPTIPMPALPLHPPAADLHPSSGQLLLSTLASSSHAFLQPSQSLHVATLLLAKRYLDPLATATSDAQAARQQEARKKRKRGEADEHDSHQMLRSKQVYLDGFAIGQVWEQARRVLDASRQEVERCLPDVLSREHGGSLLGTPDKENARQEGGPRMVRFDEDGFEVGSSGADDMEVEVEVEELADNGRVIEPKILLSEEEEPDAEVFGEDDSADNDNSELEEISEHDEGPSETFLPDKNGLNDGFFSIDDFNKQSDFLEQQDARGEPDEGAASDEEEVDWDADPQTMAPSQVIRQDDDGAAEDLREDEDGPTFGNADIHASDASEDDVPMEDIGSMSNTNNISYADFFEPPPRKASASNRRRPLPKTQPPARLPDENEEDVQRTISAVRRDIFEDDLSPHDASSNPPSDTEQDPSDPRSRRSNHQKRQAKLAEEIRRLEAANIAKRDWTLSGEARAVDRPINSLLEEDLEFERAGKPIPVITNEVSEDIEVLIKRRILAKDFDEVIRRRPGNLATGNGKDVRRGRFELADTKPQQSLAEMYEAEHLKNANPSTHIDKPTAKLLQQEAAISALWNEVSSKLDSLSSWHYKPAPPTASINVIADVPTISIEDARPSTGADIGGESMLAPQEVYKPGESGVDKTKEVVLRSGVPVAREEMSREEKLRRRRRAKERIRKVGGGDGAVELQKGKGVKGGKKAEEKNVVGELKKGGVRVIGRRGEIRDVEGNKTTAVAGNGVGAGGYKL